MLRIITECQIASAMWNANASDRKIPFTDRYVNFSRYLNNALSERNRAETGTVRGVRVNRVKARMQISRQPERLSIDRRQLWRGYICIFLSPNTFTITRERPCRYLWFQVETIRIAIANKKNHDKPLEINLTEDIIFDDRANGQIMPISQFKESINSILC